MITLRPDRRLMYAGAPCGGFTAPLVVRETGPAEAPKPRLLDRVRQAIRARHYSRRTEKAYAAWIKRYIFFHGKRHPADMGAAEVARFLTALAVQSKVAASTQNQALSALLFLYRIVLGVELPWLDDVVRAKRPQYLPIVLTQDEVGAVLLRLDGVRWLMAVLLYGAGLRLLECCRLRVKDIDFATTNQIVVRDVQGQERPRDHAAGRGQGQTRRPPEPGPRTASGRSPPRRRLGRAALGPGAQVQAILAARVDRLAAEDKRLLQTASVVGKDVPFALLQAIAELPDEALRGGLDRLRAAEFLYETGLFPDLEYAFKHALTHGVTYSTLLQERRRNLHGELVGAIERLHAHRLGEQIERLAHHALRGELWEKAVAYLRQAGLRAMAQAAYREAVAHLEQALGALRRLPEARQTTELTINILIDLRNALEPLDWGRMEEPLHEAEMLARALGDQHHLARIATFMADQCWTTGKYDAAVRFGQEALSIARTLGDRAIEVAATSYLGLTHLARGEFSDAATFLERNVALEGDLRHERFGTPFIQSAFSGAWLADVLSQLGRFDEAIEHADAAVRIAEPADHPLTLFQGLFFLGLAHLRRGDLPRATRVLEGDSQGKTRL